ncbi:phytase [Alteromonas sediminis]|uniref:Phytase n=1 Tax=Alteromonas sediminis TaxID=2259342 RepID=A0A3N5Y7A2_9ALTE|nr:phytase [Alteromonas sediminis]RPJ66609.1 phytase [Alteromonas sediminis]
MKKFIIHSVLIASVITMLPACESLNRDALQYKDASSVTALNASVETTPVSTSGDAADDPAIWVHPTDKSKSFVIGTNKKSGLAVYNLQGEQIQFLQHGLPNNVDIRQGMTLNGKPIDVGAFSDRADNTVGWIRIDETGIEFIDKFTVNTEPYGFCLAHFNNKLFAFVTYKTGLIEQYELREQKQSLDLVMTDSYQLSSQLEGCVADDKRNRLFVGEEEYGIWVFDGAADKLTQPLLIDKVGSNNGIVADIEGLTLFHSSAPLLIASSQGNDSFAVYEATPPYTFKSRFRVVANTQVDGAQETDGIDVTNTSLPGFPNGLFVAQDGFNDDGKQNFKLVPIDL